MFLLFFNQHQQPFVDSKVTHRISCFIAMTRNLIYLSSITYSGIFFVYVSESLWLSGCEVCLHFYSGITPSFTLCVMDTQEKLQAVKNIILNLFYNAFRVIFLNKCLLYISYSLLSLDKHESSPLIEVQADEGDNEHGSNVFV